ncbi:MAG: ABC transporter ATP-binding protein [Planctomycetes bacterium]|nr:ABC transporter ATP-binding protein [Planctomycetota bacterium]
MNDQTGSDSPVVSVVGVHKTYAHPTRPVRALAGVDLTIQRGELAVVMGASGSGKSTLLHLIGGLDRPDRGSVVVGGQDLAALSNRALTLFRRRRVGFVFQAFNLIGTLTAAENVALPMAIDRADRAAIRSRTAELLDLVGLTRRADHRPDAMSGGEQQRVAIARALLMDPEIILADEPTGNLDSTAGEGIWALFERLVSELGKTVCVVTHEPRASAHARRILVLADGRIAGRIDIDECKHDAALVATRYQELAGAVRPDAP